MNWLEDALDRLAACTPGGYRPGAPVASEPTAWAAVALSRGGRLEPARRACDWLADCQQRGGAVGVTEQEETPAWPTSLAILAWRAWNKVTGEPRYDKSTERAVRWALATRGRTVERKPQIGHDTTLVGWSWAEDTHSWLEPTAMFVRALKAAGHGDHPRTREAVRLLTDRLLPTGGANYGNTRVLHQYLLPHVQPTGIAMWALADEPASDPRVAASLDYLETALNEPLGAASLAYAALGLRSHGRSATAADSMLATAVDRQQTKHGPYQLALVANAAQAQRLS